MSAVEAPSQGHFAVAALLDRGKCARCCRPWTYPLSAGDSERSLPAGHKAAKFKISLSNRGSGYRLSLIISNLR